MSGPYHVHEGKAFQSKGLFDRAKAVYHGTNTKGTFPIEKFLTEGKMSFNAYNKCTEVGRAVMELADAYLRRREAASAS